jgi:prepilin signal peptidase PulO-like enzyme (type II secretory pathway)
VHLTAWLQIPLPGRLAIIALIGVAAGSLANLAAWRLACEPRGMSPWWPPAPGRRWSDRWPLVGWWMLRREAPRYGRGFWLRPLLVEVFCGGCFAGLYAWETLRGELLQPALPLPPPGALVSSDVLWIVHLNWLAHLLLGWLMLVASLIDLDEKTIPDTLTVPGTLLALLLAAWCPWSLLPGASYQFPETQGLLLGFVHLASPREWPGGLDAAPAAGGLLLALACWWGWCFALLPRKWRMRRGLAVAWQVFWRRLVRDRLTPWWGLLALVGSLAIGVAWRRGAGAGWSGLLSALVGLAAAGGLVWAVRLVGSAAMRREAMGFGDVTLMAMQGAFLGWQAALLVFFLAPLAAVAAGILQRLCSADDELPYGPFLCLAAVAVVVYWGRLWPEAQGYFALGWLVPAVLGAGLVLLFLLLIPVSWLSAALRRRAVP